MGNSFGRNVLGTVGKSIQLSADGKPEMKVAGVTIDWSLVVAHSGADLTLEDGVVITDGEKYLRYGQPVSRVSVTEVQTLDLSPGADPTGGTWDITNIFGVPILDIPYNASAATLQALIRAALSEFAGSEKITVSLATFVYTITFPLEFGNVPTITVDGSGMTTATAITVATTTAGVANAGKFGPAYTDATDGRQTLTRGGVFLVNETVKETDLHSDHPPVLEGGKVWRARIVTASPNPTLANLETALPRLTYADF
jgi:hypothetical protein